MAIEPQRLQQLRESGWRLTRDGSTGTARLNWDDPEDPETNWELLVLHTAGHPNRFSLDAAAVSERPVHEARALAEAFSAALDLLDNWTGELPDGEEG